MTFVLAEKVVDACGKRAFRAQQGTVIYADRVPREPGAVQLGDQSATIATIAVLVFRDEQPGVSWAHRCSYALVDIYTREILGRCVADQPPNCGYLPSSWMVVSDPDGLADLVPPSEKPDDG